MQDDLFAINKASEIESNRKIRLEKREDKANDWLNFNCLRWGIAAGLGMSVYLVILQLLGYPGNIGFGFFKYIVLAIFIFYGLSSVKSHMGLDFRYVNGMKAGATITGVSALSIALFNILLFAWTGNDLTFDKFLKIGDSLSKVSMISGLLFFEALVFGMILTFIWMQFIKPKRSEIRTDA